MPNFFRSMRRVFLAAALCGAPLVAAEDAVSYSRQVRPLLEAQCLVCHGAAQTLSDLDLSTLGGMRKGGLGGPAVVSGDAESSTLYRHVAGLETPRMPLGGTLEAEHVEMLRLWIEQGAKVDSTEVSSTTKTPGAEKIWWAFEAPVRPDPPMVSNPAWVENAIDAIVFERLEAAGLRPAPEAGKRRLIRRAYLDLHGLPPTSEEVERFLADDSADAFEKVVDGLLDSPRYGERWGRHWLDVVRYADSSGYEHDYDYPHAWRFRDYVIEAFNEDKPFDRFVVEQLAGDELEDGSFDTLVATGFYRVGARILFREKDNPGYRYEYLDDMIATTGHAFLGLSVECARCHDHKFDPIQQLDYYRMMAVFFPHIRYDFPLASPEEVAVYEAKKEAVEARTKPLRARIRTLEKPYKDAAWKRRVATFPEDIRLAVETEEERRSAGQKLLAAQVLTLGSGPVREDMTAADLAEVKRLEGRIESLEKELPTEAPKAMGVRDGDYRSAPDGRGDEVQPGKGEREDYVDAGPWIPTAGHAYTPPVAHLLPTANYRQKGEEVRPGLIAALSRPGSYRPEPPNNGRVSTGRRLALARWIASAENPLTARVAANRIWQHHFGRGIVSTASNFGKMGEQPTHPKLLDWLATELVRNNWSFKAMHRVVMRSRTYRMASAYGSEKALDADPQNRLLWRYPKWRLEGEAIRDSILHVAGSLNDEAGGEPFFQPIPKSVRDSFLKGRWTMTEESPAVWRRSVYAYAKRGLRYPMFELFDQPSPNVSCEARTTTTVPTQALTLLNNEFVLIQAKRFAERVSNEAGGERRAQIERAYSIALSRPPTEREMDDNLSFLSQRSLTDLCDVLLNLNELVYVE